MNKLCIIGIGLIGGSLGLDCKRKAIAKKVVGVVRRESAVVESLSAGVVDAATLDLNQGVSDADFIILATPVAAIIPLAETIQKWVRKDAVIIDVASVKGPLVAKLDRMFALGGRSRYVGTHPMAGSEKKGVSGAREDLYQGSTCLICPTENTDEQAQQIVVDFWQRLGAEILILTAEEHDSLVALSSHLPHLAAASLITVLEDGGVAKRCIGPGFRDSTRIAGSNPGLWREICEWNQEKILESLEKYQKQIAEIKAIIASGDWQGLEIRLSQAKKFRDSL